MITTFNFLKILAGGMLLVSLLSACGFQPRGSTAQIPAQFSPMQIVGLQPYDRLTTDLMTALGQAGVELTEDEGAASRLRISNRKQKRRTLSVDGRGKTAEIELAESFQFQLLAADGSELIPEQRLRVLRELLNPEDEVLGRSLEEEQLREVMRRELASRLVRRIARQAP